MGRSTGSLNCVTRLQIFNKHGCIVGAFVESVTRQPRSRSPDSRLAIGTDQAASAAIVGAGIWHAVTERRRPRAVLTRVGSQTGRANGGRRQATSSDNDLRFPQLAGPLGLIQPRAATLGMRLKAEGRRFDPTPDHQFCM